MRISFHLERGCLEVLIHKDEIRIHGERYSTSERIKDDRALHILIRESQCRSMVAGCDALRVTPNCESQITSQEAIFGNRMKRNSDPNT